MHVEGGSSYPALLEGLGQGLLVHQPAARRVHQEGALPHLWARESVSGRPCRLLLILRGTRAGSLAPPPGGLTAVSRGRPCSREPMAHGRPHLLNGEVVDEVVVVLVEVAVQGHTVALIQQVLQGVDPLHAQGPLDPVLQVGVVEDDAEAKGLGSNGDGLPRATCAERERPGERGWPLLKARDWPPCTERVLRRSQRVTPSQLS